MDKILTLLLIVVVVDIIARNQPKGISHQTNAVRRYQYRRRFRAMKPRCRHEPICFRWWGPRLCFWKRICTH